MKAPKTVSREAIREQAKRLVRPAAGAVLVAHREAERQHDQKPTAAKQLQMAQERAKAAGKAQGRGIQLHKAEQKRVHAAKQMISRKGVGGRPKSKETIAREKAIAAGTFVKRSRGRQWSEAGLAKKKAREEGTVRKRGRQPGWRKDKPEPKPVLAKAPKIPKLRGKMMSPDKAIDAAVKNKHGLGRVVREGKAAGEFGQHYRGHTLISYQDKTAQATRHGVKSSGHVYKFARRSMTLGKKGKERHIEIVRAKKSDGSGWTPYHSTRHDNTQHTKKSEFIKHDADPRRTKKTQIVTTQNGTHVASASGRTSKAFFPGHTGHSLPDARVPETGPLSSSVAKGLPKRTKRAK